MAGGVSPPRAAGWDPSQYARYASERARPFLDLLGRVPPIEVARAADVGCGPGDMSLLLAERWPDAEIALVDSSPAMALQARANVSANPRLSVVEADVSSWEPPAPLDLLFSNATLHWVADHERLIPRLAARIAPGGVFAVQMPGNHDAASHRAIRAVAARPRWRERTEGLAELSANGRPLPWYVETLEQLGFGVEAWETTYLQRLTGEDPVLEWVKGTALRPFIDRLEETAPDFLAELGWELRAAYPPRDGRVLFPYRRIFFVARRPAN